MHFDQAQRTRYSKGGFASKHNGLREQFDSAHRPPQPSVVITINEPRTSTKLSEQGTRRVVLLQNITRFESSSTLLTDHLSHRLLSQLTNSALRPSSANKVLEGWFCFEI